jgi:hypothetical protein
VRYENQQESYREIQVDGQLHYEAPEADLGEFFHLIYARQQAFCRS